MTTYTPVIRNFASDRSVRVRLSSTRRWALDRVPHARRSREWTLERTLQGAVFGGPGVISGVLTVNGAPARRRVCVHLESDGARMRDGYSSAVDGTFAYIRLLPGTPYTVIAYDETGECQALIWNGVMPTV